MIVQNHLDQRKGGDFLVPKIKCKSGLTLSVQASSFHYCIPREDGADYTHVEVGFPSKFPPRSWDEYEEKPFEPSLKQRLKRFFRIGEPDTIYAYIPIEMVDAWISKNNETTITYKVGRLIAHRFNHIKPAWRLGHRLMEWSRQRQIGLTLTDKDGDLT